MVYDHYRLRRFDNLDNIITKGYLYLDDFRSKALMVFDPSGLYRFNNLDNIITKGYLHLDDV